MVSINLQSLYLVSCLMISAFIFLELTNTTSLTSQLSQCLPKTLQFSKDGFHNENKKTKSWNGASINSLVWLQYNGMTWQGLQLPILSWYGAGNLGNLMGIYATQFGIGKVYNATILLHPTLRAQLIDTFPNLTMPLMPANVNFSEWINLDHYEIGSFGAVEAAAAGILGPHLFVGMGSAVEIQFFSAYREEIRKEFTFSEAIQMKVRDFWKNQIYLFKDTVFVGFHIRRTDYLNFIKFVKSHLPGPLFFKNALDFYRNKFSSVLFVVASDDMGFAKSSLGNNSDVIFAPGTNREEDMGILASCNHSVITFGTFGLFCGLLTGGIVVYPDISADKIYPMQRNRYEMADILFMTLTLLIYPGLAPALSWAG